MATIAAVTLVGAATSAETRVTAAGPDWLPLKGKYKNAIGCTWNNGCESPTHGYHSPRQAIDFTVGVDVPVYAAGPGQVEIAWDTCGEGDVACGPGTSRFGNAVAIRHPDGRYSWYAHLSQVLVGEGSDVAAGDLIGKTGNTGESFGAHLHYEEHQGSPWGNTVPPGPMRAYHGADLVSYPDVLGAKAWQDLGCGKQQGEAGCKEKWLIQNDGYKPTKAGGGGGGSGGGSGGSAKSGKCTTNRLGVVFILDDSGSNQATDPRYLRADAARVALSYLPEGTLVSALKFSDSAQTVVPATRLTDRNESPIADR